MKIWFEQLPDQCPPKDAFSVNGELFYRLVESLDSPIEAMVSQRFEFPNKVFRIDECTCCSVSIHKNREDCEKMTKFPRHKNKKVFGFKLYKDDGLIKKTFTDSHHSWWRNANFAIEK